MAWMAWILSILPNGPVRNVSYSSSVTTEGNPNFLPTIGKVMVILPWPSQVVRRKTAIAYITSMSGCHLDGCNSVTKDIRQRAIVRRCWLSASFTPEILNMTADQLSRKFNAGTEWKLSHPIFLKIALLFGTPCIDRFASRIN